jgi:hypothetical protein
MVLAIPRWPRKKATSEIASYLRDQRSHRISKRSVERDLIRLQDDFGYTCEELGRTQLWFYPAEKKVLDLPAMDGPLALAFLLSREYLTPLLPPATLKLIAPYFHRAEEALREVPGSLAAWRSRVYVMTRGPHLRGPKIPPDVQAEVYEAVLGGHQLSIEYRRRDGKSDKAQVVHPQGLLVYEGVAYLVAVASGHQQAVTYSLHRVRSAKRLDIKARALAGFDLPSFAKKIMRFPVSDGTIRLVARFNASVAKHLEERPLSADQNIRADGDYSEVSATVEDAEDLRWWLLGFGDLVEVLAPATLRNDLRRRIRAMHERYEAR